MASRASYSVVHHTLASLELLARQAVTTASHNSNNMMTMSRSSNGSIWASTSKAWRSASTSPIRPSSPSLARASLSSSTSPTLCRTDDDASHLRRILFKQHDTRPASQPGKMTRRIARLYSRRPLLRQLENLRFSSSSPASYSRPFFTSSFRTYSTNTGGNGGNSSSSSSSSTSSSAESEAKPGLMGKLKDLTRKYGWATVVVYLLFSALDFGAVFFLINLVGAEHVRKGQDYVLDALVYGSTKKEDLLSQAGEAKGDGVLGFLKSWREKHKVEDAENKKSSGGNSSLWATAVLAYGIHKTLLLPLRLGLTAATTPAIVK